MSMSRRHFRKLAAAIRETYEDIDRCRCYKPEIAVQILTSKIVRICEEENVNFNYNRFHEACQPEVVE